MAIFGYEAGATEARIYYDTSPYNYVHMRASFAAPAESGVADSISAFFTVVDAEKNVQCALYEYVDHSSDYAGGRIAVTEEKGVSSTGVNTFNFGDPKPSVVASTNYYLVMQGSDASDDVDLKIKAASLGDKSFYKNAIVQFSAFTDPMVSEVSSSWTYGIYCTYTPVAGEEHTHVASDTIAISDSFAAKMAFKQALSDSVTIADSMAPVMTFKQALSDTVNISDAIAVVAAYKVAIADTIIISDSIVAAAKYVVALADTINISDSSAAELILKIALSDTMQITDSMVAILTEGAVIVRRKGRPYGLRPARVAKIGRVGL